MIFSVFLELNFDIVGICLVDNEWIKKAGREKEKHSGEQC